MRAMLLRSGFALFIGLVAIAPAARAADSGPSPSDPPGLAAARADIKAKQYTKAAEELKVLAVKYPTADVYSLLGHALWKTGDPTQGMTYYNKALALDPNHKGALEYQGELFIELGQIDKAKANLAKLDHICWLGCEEEDDLKEALQHSAKRS